MRYFPALIATVVAATLLSLTVASPQASAQTFVPILLHNPDPHPGDGFGAPLRFVGDLDGDGVSDIAVGAAGIGRVYLFSGRTRAPLAISPLLNPSGRPFGTHSSSFPASIAAINDVDNDGVPDLVVGDNEYNARIGRVYVFSGLTGAVSVIENPSGEAHSEFGLGVTAIPDVDGDGVQDIHVSAHKADGVEFNQGRAFFFSGAPPLFPALSLSPIENPVPQNNADFGWVPIGLDGRFLRDLYVAAPEYDGAFGQNEPGGFTPAAGYPTCGTGGTLVSHAPAALGGTFQCYFPDGPASSTVATQVQDDDGMLSNRAEIPVTVANAVPAITGVTGPSGPLALGTTATLSVAFTDAGTLDTHTCQFAWDDGTTSTVAATSGGGSGSCSAARTYANPGVYSVGITVTDDDTGSVATVYDFVVVYDPDGGFVTGGGWIQSPAGAYRPDPTLTGRATFGFVSKYKKGMSVPDGQTEFQFQVAGLNFHSTMYEWLVVAGHKAQYRGSGTVNGTGDYRFILTARDGQRPGGGGVDKFRIKISDAVGGGVVYDNVNGSADVDTEPQAIGGGSIVIHD